MPYIHDPYPKLSRRPYARDALGRDPLALPWTGDPSAIQTYGPYVGSGLSPRAPAPWRPVGAADQTNAQKAKNGLFAIALVVGGIWLAFRLAREKPRKNPRRRRNAKLRPRARRALSAAQFAMPRARKLPIHDASHVRNAMARFGQVRGATGAQKARAYHNIMAAARRFGIRAAGFERKYGGRYRRRA